MCLELNIRKAEVTSGIGYKLFCPYPCNMDNYPRGIYGWLYGHHGYMGYHESYNLHEWYTAVEVDRDIMKYTTGFHIIEKLEDAKEFLAQWPGDELYRVQYEEAHTIGEEVLHSYRNMSVIVARQMLILGKVEE